MNHGLAFDIALCIIAAWVMGLVCQALKQPLLIAYLVAGFVIGPHGLRWVTAQESIETISQIGLSLLLFMIGLEMDLKKMLGAGRAITVTALVQIIGCLALGWAFFGLLGPGQGWLEAFYLAVAAAMSSTVIIIKLETLGSAAAQEASLTRGHSSNPPSRRSGERRSALAIARA